MVKNLRTFIKDVQEKLPGEFIRIKKEINPGDYEVTAIIKKLDEMKKFPVILFENVLNLHGEKSEVRVLMNELISQSKVQVVLDIPLTTDRVQIAEKCLELEEKKVKPVVVKKEEAPVKKIIQLGEEADLYDLPILRHHYMDGGPYIVMPTVVRDRESRVYNLSFHRMEVKNPRLTGFYSSPRHLWKIFKDFEDRNEPCPAATIIGHHPAFNMGSAYKGPFFTDEYDIIGGYLGEPLRLVPSETFGDNLLVPADAEIIIEGVLLPNERITEGPFGEATGYLGPQRYDSCLKFEVRAITCRKDAMYVSIITPEGDKPWMDMPREGAYLRRVREAVPSVKAVCKGGRHAHYNIFISMKKMAPGDPGRAAAAALSFDHSKNVFVFDEDINVFNPTEILWALATRVQPHKQVSIIKDILRGNMLDPSLQVTQEDIKTSGMIIDATRPFGKPYSPVSRCPEDVLKRIDLKDFVDKDTLNDIPLDRTTYWC